MVQENRLYSSRVTVGVPVVSPLPKENFNIKEDTGLVEIPTFPMSISLVIRGRLELPTFWLSPRHSPS
jgi:hypothetical protein